MEVGFGWGGCNGAVLNTVLAIYESFVILIVTGHFVDTGVVLIRSIVVIRAIRDLKATTASLKSI